VTAPRTTNNFQPVVHSLALFMALVALAPIGLGALVTTKDAGMAFPDWPTSDGHGMFSYPWWQSAGAKFLEHGHRLAGVLIGCATIVFCGAACWYDSRVWVRWLAGGLLLAVVGQGVLGGLRVLLDERGLAFLHGSLASLAFALMCALATMTSRSWFDAAPVPADLRHPLITATCATVALFAQYVLGGLLRHQGRVLFEHLGFAFVAAFLAIWLAMTVVALGVRWLSRPAVLLALLTLAQLGLGAGAWITRFGLGGYVAVYGSTSQVLFRTAHVLAGLLLFSTCVVLLVRLARLRALSTTRSARSSVVAVSAAGGLS